MALHDVLLAGNRELVYLDCVGAEAISTVVRRLREKGCSEDVRAILECPTNTRIRVIGRRLFVHSDENSWSAWLLAC